MGNPQPITMPFKPRSTEKIPCTYHDSQSIGKIRYDLTCELIEGQDDLVAGFYDNSDMFIALSSDDLRHCLLTGDVWIELGSGVKTLVTSVNIIHPSKQVIGGIVIYSTREDGDGTVTTLVHLESVVGYDYVPGK